MEIRNLCFEDIHTILNPGQPSVGDVLVFERKFLTSEHILNPETMSPVRFDVRAFIICTYGELTYSMDYTPGRLNKGALLCLTNFHVIDKIHIVNHCELIAVVISQNLAMSIGRSTSAIEKMMKNMKGRPEPVIKLEDNEMRLLTDIIRRIKNCQKNTGHAFQNQIVRNETSNFILETANINIQRLQKANLANQKTNRESRKNEIFRDFLQLLMNNYKEQHQVAFYAEKTGMTPDNLSRSVTAVSGKSPIQWISETLVSEAKTLLHKPDATINQVADELHFGDQSSFGKFFRKHTGMTPMEYKNRAKV